MKKYIAAGGVAVVAFAFAASAASLTVDGGILQAGADNDLTCTDAVTADFVGFEGDAVEPGGDGTRLGGGFQTMTLAGLGAEACDGASVYARVFDNDGVEIWRSVPIPTASGDTLSYPFSGGVVRGGYTLKSATPAQAGSLILSSDIAGIEVQIDG